MATESQIERSAVESRVQPRRTVRILPDLLFTVLLLALVVCGPLYLVPAISGKPESRPLGSVLFAAVFPIGTLLSLSVIERLFAAAGPRKSLKAYLLHLQINVFYLFMAGIAGTAAALSVAALAHRLGFQLGLIDLRFATGRGMLTLLGAAWLSAIVSDFFFYWFHRTLHKTPFLWAHHKLHHMDPELEAITIARQNWIEVFLAALFMTVPLTILFKFDNLTPWQFGIVTGTVLTVVTTLFGIGHLNVRLQVGRASLFYCSPQVHRIHHSRLPEHQDKNLAFVFPLWDVLFGTYYPPAKDEFPPTGVEGEEEIESFWEAQIFTPREWWRIFRAWRRRHGAFPA
jgi:sterol desaturase/sphingolipid hydroxylase (fatty acid hydroxylase superfamily)